MAKIKYTPTVLNSYGIRVSRHNDNTWLQCETASPNGGLTRLGVAVCIWDGRKRRVYAGIPDTWFTVPAKCAGQHGYLTIDWLGRLVFTRSKASSR